MFYAVILAKNTYRYTDIRIHIDCNRLTVQFPLRNTHTHEHKYVQSSEYLLSCHIFQILKQTQRNQHRFQFQIRPEECKTKNKEKMEMEILLSKCAQLKTINKQI